MIHLWPGVTSLDTRGQELLMPLVKANLQVGAVLLNNGFNQVCILVHLHAACYRDALAPSPPQYQVELASNNNGLMSYGLLLRFSLFFDNLSRLVATTLASSMVLAEILPVLGLQMQLRP